MEQNKVQQFLNDNFGEVRAFANENKIWFVAKDICNVLGIGNPSLAINGNPTRKDKGVGDKNKGIYNVNTLGGNQDLLCVSEQGLYKLIFKSRKPFAEEFQDWICETVIPSIRKDGGYIQGEEEFAKGGLSEEELVLQAMTILQNKVVRLKQENEEMKPKVRKWDQFIKTDGTYSFTECAKLVSTMAETEQSDISITVSKLTELLRNEGILNKSKTPDKEGKKGSYKNLPNKDYEAMFDVVSVGTGGGFNKTQTRVKSNGVEFIYDLLKNKQKKEA